MYVLASKGWSASLIGGKLCRGWHCHGWRSAAGDRREAIADPDAFLTDFRIDIVSVDDRLARVAMKARIEYGQGFGTRGGLNFGDCFAYALARQHSAPLLYIGNDFGLTDIRSALEAPAPKKPKR